jgi:hypothetical protein
MRVMACESVDDFDSGEQLAEAAPIEDSYFSAERCPASGTSALHVPIWTSDTSGHCARCKIGFFA